MKIRHILLAVLAPLAIAFLQPLITFLGGLTLLLGVGILVFRDLTPAGQDAVERQVLGWLRRARAGSTVEPNLPTVPPHQIPATSVKPGLPVERPRRERIRPAAPADPTGGSSAPPVL
ncbi:MAG: hypothetical protein WAV07_08275 [Candidatus Contendobacter sp.]